MYKVLIADDEEIIRRGIAHFLKKDPDIQVVAQAEDGEMALEQAMEYHPDLLFVDINMPFLNGLDFIEKLKTVQPDALILVITGYDDFKYAQKALRLGVFDYLLKPIMEDTFYEALGKAKDQLGHRQKQAQYLEWARALVEKNRPALIAEFLEGWLDGRFTEAEIQERISALGLELPEPVGVTLVHLENKDNAEIGGEWDEDLLFYAAENMANEVFQTLRPVSTCRNSAGELVLLTAGGTARCVGGRGGTAQTLAANPPAGGCLPHPALGGYAARPACRIRRGVRGPAYPVGDAAACPGCKKIHRRKLCPGGILPHRDGGLYACLPAAPEPGVPPEHGHHFYGLYHAGTHPPGD